MSSFKVGDSVKVGDKTAKIISVDLEFLPETPVPPVTPAPAPSFSFFSIFSSGSSQSSGPQKETITDSRPMTLIQTGGNRKRRKTLRRRL